MKPKPKPEPKRTFSVRVRRSLYDKLAKAARGARRSLSAHCAYILEGGK